MQTCQTLRSIVSQTQAWKEILRLVMRSHGYFMVSYSLDDMSLRDLQRAATGPDRWKKFALTNARSKVQEFSSMSNAEKHVKLSTGTTERGLLRMGHTYRLIPGGRFLLVADVSQGGEPETMESFATVTLWDLHPQGNLPGAQPVRVASHLIASGTYPVHPLSMRVDACITSETELELVAVFAGTSPDTKS